MLSKNDRERLKDNVVQINKTKRVTMVLSEQRSLARTSIFVERTLSSQICETINILEKRVQTTSTLCLITSIP